MSHVDKTESVDTVHVTLVSVCHTSTNFVMTAENLFRIWCPVIDAADQPNSELNVSGVVYI